MDWSHISIADDEIANKISIAMISCTMSIPRAILPYVVLESHLSDTNFTITMVLENVSHIAISILAVRSNHKSIAIINPITEVNITCHVHAIAATFHTSLMIAGFSHSHTMNNNNDTPKYAYTSICQ